MAISKKRLFRIRVTKHFLRAPLLALAVLHVLILACSGTRSARVLTVDDMLARQSPHGANLAAGPKVRLPEYRIGILDQLEIRFYYHERFNETVAVRPDGRIALQLVGDIEVAGMTPAELDRVITAAYADIVESPEVTVIVRSFAGLTIYVLGEVSKPGLFEMKPNMTVLQALAAAGGPIKGAKLNSVIVLRKDEADELKAFRLDFSPTLIKHGVAQDQRLLPQDIVYVPKTFIADVNAFLSQIYDGLFPPFDIYLRALREYNKNR
ncbi:MAG: polysaccharide biosynthesis/export family protein [bacterium]